MAIDEFALRNAAVVDRRFVYQNRVILQEIVNLKNRAEGVKIHPGLAENDEKLHPGLAKITSVK